MANNDFFILNDEQIKEMKKNFRFYDKFYTFYKYILLVQNYAYKIMVTRRSYVLFKIFLSIFIFEDKKYEKCDISNVYNSNYVNEINFSNNANILVVDDIIINGRSIDTICSIIDKKANIDSSGCKITLLPYVINSQAKCIDNIRNLFDEELKAEASESQWREISNQLNSFIIDATFGNVSYINTYRVDNYMSLFEKKGIFNKKNKIAEAAKFDNYYINSNSILKDKNYENLWNKFSIYSCIRIQKRGNKLAVIPFVYLPTINADCFIKYFNEILQCFEFSDKVTNEKIQGIKSYANKKERTNSKLVFLYKWLTYFLSECVADKMVQEIKSSTNEFQLTKCISCRESFSDNFYFDSIKCKLKQNELNAIAESFKNTSNDEFFGDECYKILTDVYKKISNRKTESITVIDNNFIYTHLNEYLAEIRKVDQKRAEKKQERLEGLTVNHVMNFFEQIRKNKVSIKQDENDIINILIYLWDIGNASGAPKIVHNCICNSTINGEHIYRYYFDKKPQITFDFKVFYNNTGITDEQKIRKFAKHMDNYFGTKDYEFFVEDIFNNGVPGDFENGLNVEDITECENDDNIKIIMNYLYDTTHNPIYLY